MQHAARFQTDLTDMPVGIEIDPGQLEQALLNLAVNSRDAMPSGGVLRMSTRIVTITERTAVERGALVPGEYVTIAVEDSGSGMSAEVRSRLFEPFFTTKPIGSGTGLGLAMVLGVIHQAGGHIRVREHTRRGHDHHPVFPGRAAGRETARTAAERCVDARLRAHSRSG